MIDKAIASFAGQKMHSHGTIVYLYLSCVRAKNTLQSLLRDVGQCCKEVPLPSKALWRHGMHCSAASQ